MKGILSSDPDRFPLTEAGREQIRSVAESLRGIQIDGLFSSPVRRARESAEIIAETIGYSGTVKIDKRLGEQGYGKLNNTHNRGGMWILDAIDPAFGVEDITSVYERMSDFVRSIEGSKIVIAVSHKDPISSFVMKPFGWDIVTGRGINIGRGSISVVHRDGNNIKVLAIGMPIMAKHVLDRIMKLSKQE